jgi:Domain of unknown function (DUF4157)
MKATKRHHDNQLEPHQQNALSILERPGLPLDAETRGALEPRFGHNFGDVRVHSGGEAARAARNLEARAFAVGQDVVLGDVDTSTPEGFEILTHELAHTVQNAHYGPAKEMKLSGVGDAAETSAQAAASTALSGGSNAGAIASRAIPTGAVSLWNLGWTPEETHGGPYANIGATFNSWSDWNVSGGLGLANTSNPDGSRARVLSGDVAFGNLGGTPGQNQRWGARADGGLVGVTTGERDSVGIDAGVLRGGAEASWGDDGFSGGVQGNLIDFAMMFGDINPNETDTRVRVGASLGEGLAARYRDSDTDGDGRRERGIGVDIGPFSGDFTTERDPVGWVGEQAEDAYRWMDQGVRGIYGM